MAKPQCRLCASTRVETHAHARDEEYFTSDDVFRYYRCPACDVVFIDPIPSNRLGVIYPSNYYSFDPKVIGSPVFRVKDALDRRFFKKLLETVSGDNLAALDVGGGAGWMLDNLRRADARVDHTCVVDLDAEAGDEARRRGHEYHRMRFEEFDSERRFHVIILFNIVEHVADPKAVLARVRQLLHPEGLAVVKTPNTDSLDARLFRHRNWGGFHCPRHWVLFNKASFSSLVEDSGLAVRTAEFTQGAPFWTTSVMYALRRTGLIHASSAKPIPQHPLYQLLNAAFAAFDLVRGVFFPTSQMFFVVERSSSSGGAAGLTGTSRPQLHR